MKSLGEVKKKTKKLAELFCHCENDGSNSELFFPVSFTGHWKSYAIFRVFLARQVFTKKQLYEFGYHFHSVDNS